MHHKSVADRGTPYIPLDGPLFQDFQLRLTNFNRKRLAPSIPIEDWQSDMQEAHDFAALEACFIETARREIAPLLLDMPERGKPFMEWFEHLKHTGPGQGDALFPFLAEEANYEQMKWFLLQEVAGEAGFEDLVALTQVKMPVRPKLEMARNYWDEMGRGGLKGMHGPMLERLARHFNLEPKIESSVAEALALGNVMMAFACNRRYAYHSAGALGVIEMTAPTRAVYVVKGLKRLGVPAKESHYFSLHAVLDVKHSDAWNTEVLMPLVESRPECAHSLAEGALLRLWCGARCFERYRRELGVSF